MLHRDLCAPKHISASAFMDFTQRKPLNEVFQLDLNLWILNIYQAFMGTKSFRKWFLNQGDLAWEFTLASVQAERSKRAYYTSTPS